MSDSLMDDLGKVDNLSEPEPFLNKKEAILGIVITFLVLSSTCAYGRLWIRVTVTRTPGLDDLFVFLVTLVNGAAGAAVCLLATSAGLGQHFLLLGQDGIPKFLKVFYVANALYPLSTTLIKLALLFQYMRVLEKGSKLRKLTLVVIVVVSVWGTIFSCLAFVPCMPVQAFWDLTVQATRYGYCSHNTTVLAGTFFGQAATNMMLDLIVFSIPVPLWLGSNVETKTRTALLGLFVLGAIVNVCSIFRLITLADNRAGTYPTFDPSWYGATSIVLSAVEVHLATICASLPVFWPIIKESWVGRSIMVTREVEITREKRTSADSTGSVMATMSRTDSQNDSMPWERTPSPEDGMGKGYMFERYDHVDRTRSVGRTGRATP